MRTLRSVWLACLMGMLAATRADAQFDTLSGLASNFSDLAIQWGAFIPLSHEIRPESNPKSRWIASYGAEFIFDLAKVNTSKKKKPKTQAGQAQQKAGKDTCNAAVRGDPKERRVIYARGIPDSIDIYGLEKKCKEPEPNIELEFGVGFFQTSRFVINHATGTMSGVFREAPTISVYGSSLHGGWAAFRPYGALRVGVTELVSPTLENAAEKTFSATVPKSVEIGAVLGISKQFWQRIPVAFFAETAYMYRPFSGISWAANTDEKDHPVAPPKGAPSRLNFRGWSGMFGFQLTVKDPNKK